MTLNTLPMLTLLFQGLGGLDDEDDEISPVQKLKRERILYFDEKGQAEWLIKTINDAAQENFKNRLYDNIFFLSQVPALSDKSFSSNLTGVSIKYKLLGLDELFVMKENGFVSAQKKKIRIITEYLNTMLNKKYDADTVTIKLERNFIENLTVHSERRIIGRSDQQGNSIRTPAVYT